MVSSLSVDDFAINATISGSPTMVSGSASDLGFTGYTWDNSSLVLTLNCDPTKEVIFTVLFYANTADYNMNRDYLVTSIDSTPFVLSSSSYHIYSNGGITAYRYTMVGSNSGYTLAYQRALLGGTFRATVVAYTRALA